jgi:hypothetical protein
MERNPRIETNEAGKTALIQKAAAERRVLLKGVQKLEKGDLKRGEYEVLTRMAALGRTILERVIPGHTEATEAAGLLPLGMARKGKEARRVIGLDAGRGALADATSGRGSAWRR